MDAGTGGAVPEAELKTIQASVQQGVLRIARALNDRKGGGRSPAFLKELSALEPVAAGAERSTLVFEAPHDMEQFPIEFPRGDAGVQAVELFVASVGTFIEGGDPEPDIGGPATRSVVRFIKAVAGHDRVGVIAVVGETEIAIDFEPRSIPRKPRHGPRTSLSFVGWMYGVNLATRRFRFRDELGRSRLLPVDTSLDAAAIARELIGEVVSVRAHRADDPDDHRFIAVAIEAAGRDAAERFREWQDGARPSEVDDSVTEEPTIPGMGSGEPL